MSVKSNDTFLLDIAGRIRQVREFDAKFNLAQMANAVEVDRRTWDRYEKAETSPPVEILSWLSESYNLNLAWLIDGMGPKYANDYDSEFVKVPKISVSLSAGGGDFFQREEVEGLYSFRRDWISQFGDPKEKVLFEVRGSSMEPTLCDKDMVLLDISEEGRQFIPDMVYAVRLSDVAVIKRVCYWMEEGERIGITLRSDNPDKNRYPDFNIKFLPEMENPLIGRPIWLGRRC